MSTDLKLFLTKVNQIYTEQPSYRLGGSGFDGTCDCIGLVIGALARCDVKWGGTHGTNYAVRNAVMPVNYISHPDQLELGMLVFKARKPGDAKYNLPNAYSKSPDQNDYYHVGVVTSVNPLQITHMTSPTAKIDKTLGKWNYGSFLKLKYINDDNPTNGGDEPMVETKRVYAENGLPVKLRATPSTNDRTYWSVPVGTSVTVIDTQGDWSQVYALSEGSIHKGWMLNKFLIPEGENTQNDETVYINPNDSSDVINAEMKEKLFSELDKIDEAMLKIYDLLGGRG